MAFADADARDFASTAARAGRVASALRRADMTAARDCAPRRARSSRSAILRSTAMASRSGSAREEVLLSAGFRPTLRLAGRGRRVAGLERRLKRSARGNLCHRGALDAGSAFTADWNSAQGFGPRLRLGLPPSLLPDALGVNRPSGGGVRGRARVRHVAVSLPLSLTSCRISPRMADSLSPEAALPRS